MNFDNAIKGEEFTMEEAAAMGAFIEDAMSLEDALDAAEEEENSNGK